MNTAPHGHDLILREDEDYVYFTYGDTKVSIYKYHDRFPSQRRINKAARKVIKKHDIGSMEADALTKARESVATLRSDWYMDSQERMDDLHRQALLEDFLYSNTDSPSKVDEWINSKVATTTGGISGQRHASLTWDESIIEPRYHTMDEIRAMNARRMREQDLAYQRAILFGPNMGRIEIKP